MKFARSGSADIDVTAVFDDPSHSIHFDVAAIAAQQFKSSVSATFGSRLARSARRRTISAFHASTAVPPPPHQQHELHKI